jgi:hypothetical protein
MRAGKPWRNWAFAAVLILSLTAFTAAPAIGAGGSSAGAAAAKKKPKKHKPKPKKHKPKPKKHKAKKAKKSTLKVTGPTSNTFNTSFKERVSGFAVSPANFLENLEQLNPGGGCASTYTAELGRSNVFAFPSGAVTPNHSYSMVVPFFARNHGRHGMCSYLINSTTRKTFAHGSIFWTNS